MGKRRSLWIGLAIIQFWAFTFAMLAASTNEPEASFQIVAWCLAISVLFLLGIAILMSPFMLVWRLVKRKFGMQMTDPRELDRRLLPFQRNQAIGVAIAVAGLLCFAWFEILKWAIWGN